MNTVHVLQQPHTGTAVDTRYVELNNAVGTIRKLQQFLGNISIVQVAVLISSYTLYLREARM